MNPPERVELYSNRIVVRLHREGKFLIPLKDVAGVEQVDNPFKTFCQPAFMHTRATQMSSSVYIQSKFKGVAPSCSTCVVRCIVALRHTNLRSTRRSVSHGDGAHS